MSGAVVVTPSAGAAWATAWEQFEGIRKGMLALSLTNYDATTVPQIASGSWIEAAGSIYKWTGNDAVVGGLTNDVLNYITMVPSGVGGSAILTPTWSDTPPTWSDAYQGYYSGTTRYVGGCYYDGTNYTDKWIYLRPEYHSYTRANGSPRPLKTKVLDIGDWNMDTTAGVDVAHGLTLEYIKTVQVTIVIDTLDRHTPLDFTDDDGFFYCTATNVKLNRIGAGFFDADTHDATSFNRGWVTLEYED